MNPSTVPVGGEPAPYPSHGATDNGAPPLYQQAIATATAALSSEHTPTPNAVANGRKRRATGAPGSRGVANLTPEQLAKKRANDREAQRAIRERTRNTIESLERRIRELESQQPFQDLQRVVQERDRALAECEDLRRRLEAVAGIVGGTQHQHLNELAALTAQQIPLPPLARGPSHSDTPSGQASSYEQQQQQSELHPDLRALHASQSPVLQNGAAYPTSVYREASRTLRKRSPSLDHLPNQQQSSSGSYHEHQRTSSPHLQQHSNGDRLGVNFLLDSRSASDSATPTTPSYHSPRSVDQPAWARLTLVGPPSCPLDSLLLDFISSRRQMLQSGAPVEEVIGPDCPAFAAMVESRYSTRCHPLSALLIDILSKFPDVSDLAEKVAVFYIMFIVLRWQICPCQSCYERLPECCRPTAVQLEKTHVCWADFLPFPHIRNQIARDEIHVHFEDFFVPYTETLSLNWPWGDDRILMRAPSSSTNPSPTLGMSVEFEHHARNVDNWSLGHAFSRAFPHLVDEKMQIKDR